MTTVGNYDSIDFTPLKAFTADEVVTHSPVRDVRLPSGKVLALVTLDNGRDHTRPNTLGPATLFELEETRRNSLGAELALLAMQREQQAAWIALYRAAGGGWQRAQPPPPSTY